MRTSNRHYYTPTEIAFIRKHYPEKGAEYCAQCLNLRSQPIQRWANEKGIRLNPGVAGVISRRHTINRNAPVDIERHRRLFCAASDQSIYWLGLFWADGHLEKRTTRFGIGIKASDGNQLKQLIETVMDCKGRQRSVKRYGKTCEDRIDFRQSSPLITATLREVGAEQKSIKAPTTLLMKIPANKHYLFWRGFFDGDGCACRIPKAYINTVQFAGHYDTDWSALEGFLIEHGVKYRIHRRTSSKGHRSSVLTVTRISNIQRLFTAMYPTSEYDGIGLKRKRDTMASIEYTKQPRRKTVYPNPKTGYFFVSTSKAKGYIGAVVHQGVVYRKESQDINKVISFVDEVNTRLGRYEYVNKKF